jgi:hypothetical protein
VQENFQFHVRAELPHLTQKVEVRVVVNGTTITLYGASSRLCAGVWDSGNYVRYASAGKIDVHPAILDAVDAELRLRMTLKGIQLRAEPLRRTAVGYQE